MVRREATTVSTSSQVNDASASGSGIFAPGSLPRMSYAEIRAKEGAPDVDREVALRAEHLW